MKIFLPPKRRQNSTRRPHNKNTVVANNIKNPKALKHCHVGEYLDAPVSVPWHSRTSVCVPFYFRHILLKSSDFYFMAHTRPFPLPKAFGQCKLCLPISLSHDPTTTRIYVQFISISPTHNSISCIYRLVSVQCGEGNGTPLQYSCLENSMDGGAWQAVVHGVTKSRTRQSDFPFTFHFHALEKEMATHSSVLACRIPGMGEPGGLPSLGSHRVGHD